ncbi:MAG: arylsulfatase [Acidimicrobiia bacterium]|nr:arylsulfatase [Acidimicrobiia bacterium]
MEPGEFRGRTGRYAHDSEPWWPDAPAPPDGAPNVLLVVLDDVGFAQLGCYGSDIDTPTLDRLAARWVAFSNFHTTAVCSPTRACVLTGRNHHTCGMGRITDLATGFPGYDGWDRWREMVLPGQKELGVVPAHAELSPRPDWVPAWDDLSADTQRVYARYMEAFAGFLSHTDAQIGRVVDWLDETDQLDDTVIVVLSDNGASSEGGPTGSLNDARAWNALPRTVEEARDRIDEIGGPRIHNNYPWGWTVAGNTPFRRWKRETHEGGVADPLVVHWPRGITDAGGIRTQYVHAIDVLPTLLEAIGLEAPTAVDGVEQQPVEGVSFIYTFDDPDAPERHTTQYYEMFGCRAIYHEGWKAVTYHEIQADEPGLERASWELYDLRADPTECHDLAEERPSGCGS